MSDHVSGAQEREEPQEREERARNDFRAMKESVLS